METLAIATAAIAVVALLMVQSLRFQLRALRKEFDSLELEITDWMTSDAAQQAAPADGASRRR